MLLAANDFIDNLRKENKDIGGNYVAALEDEAAVQPESVAELLLLSQNGTTPHSTFSPQKANSTGSERVSLQTRCQIKEDYQKAMM